MLACVGVWLSVRWGMTYDPQWKEKLEAKRAARAPAAAVPPVLPGAKPAKKGPGVAVGCLAVIGGGVLLLVGSSFVRGCSQGFERARADAVAPKPLRPAVPLVRVPVADLLKGVKNQVAWDQKWKGRRIIVVGPLVSVNSASFGGGGHLQIGEALAWAQVTFEKEAEDAVAKLVVGEEVAIEGTVDAVMLGWPQLSGGKVVP